MLHRRRHRRSEQGTSSSSMSSRSRLFPALACSREINTSPQQPMSVPPRHRNRRRRRHPLRPKRPGPISATVTFSMSRLARSRDRGHRLPWVAHRRGSSAWLVCKTRQPEAPRPSPNSWTLVIVATTKMTKLAMTSSFSRPRSAAEARRRTQVSNDLVRYLRL